MTTDHATRIVMSHRLLRRYVLPGERVVLATRRHWAKLLEPAATATAVFVACAWVTVRFQGVGDGVLVVWWLWFAALGRFGWYALLWRLEWFVATDKRMLLLTGLVTHQIGMMPLAKVTDMRYSRSLLGQMLGYGQFLLESAGQDQALRQINWVARPDATYRDLCALIFTPATSEPEEDEVPPEQGRDGPPPAVPPTRVPPRPSGGGVAVAPARPDAATTRSYPVPERWEATDFAWPERGKEWDPNDTQPLRVRTPGETRAVDAAPDDDLRPERRLPPTLAEAQEDATAVEAEEIAGEEALRLDEEEAYERAWDVSEPTVRFVDLRERRRRAQEAGDARPDRGNETGEPGPPA